MNANAKLLTGKLTAATREQAEKVSSMASLFDAKSCRVEAGSVVNDGTALTILVSEDARRDSWDGKWIPVGLVRTVAEERITGAAETVYP